MINVMNLDEPHLGESSQSAWSGGENWSIVVIINYHDKKQLQLLLSQFKLTRIQYLHAFVIQFRVEYQAGTSATWY